MNCRKYDSRTAKNKVNILINTWYKNGLNYGQVLQAYALQQYISTRSDENIEYSVRLLRLENRIKGIHSPAAKYLFLMVKNILKFRRKNRIKRLKFHSFIRKNIPVTEAVFSSEDLNGYLKRNTYDLLLTGSDQIWNPEGNLRDCYFWPVEGEFIKASYATGLMREELFHSEDIYREKLLRYKRWLQEFRFLSVREKDGAKILSEIIPKESRVVLDPTFLLPKEFWKEIAAGKKAAQGNYILVYILGDGKKILDKVSELKDLMGNITVYVMEAEERLKDNRFKTIRTAGPAEFLTWISQAELVITNSFHGTVFSIIFEKNFYVYPADRKGFDSNMKRVTDLLDSLNLTKRYNQTDIKKQQKIDYGFVNPRLEERVKASKDYLDLILNTVSRR